MLPSALPGNPSIPPHLLPSFWILSSSPVALINNTTSKPHLLPPGSIPSRRNQPSGSRTECENRGLASLLPLPPQMKRIQPLDSALATAAGAVPIPKQRHQLPLEHLVVPPAAPSPSVAAPKSRLKRLLERQFHRVASSEKLAAAGESHHHRVVDPGSLCLEKLVHNFLEGENSGGEEGRPCAAAAAASGAAISCSSYKCGRSRCGCFHGNCFWDEGSPEDDLFDLPPAKSPPLPPPIEPSVVIKNLLLQTTPLEKTLLSDVSTVLDKPKHKLLPLPPSSSSSSSIAFSTKTRRLATLVEGLTSLGHDASICHSRWDRAPTLNAGQHEYADVLFPCGERLIVEIDFRSEFQVARPTKEYGAVLALLPAVFVGTQERLRQVVAVAAGAAKKSLTKKGFPVAPWRTEPYMQAKWLSPGHERVPIAAAMAAAKAAAPPPFASVPVVADAGCWGNFGAVATASVVVHRTRPARVAPGSVADQDQVRGVNAKASTPTPAPPPARSRAAPPAALRRVGWAVPGPGYVI